MSTVVYRWRGVTSHGEQKCGRVSLTPAALSVFVEDRFKHGWRSLTVCSGEGPVPPPAVGPADVVAVIGPHPDTGKRIWWSEGAGS